MSADIHSSGQDDLIHGTGQIAPLADAPVVAAPKGHSTTDTSSKSGGTSQTKGVDPYSPELMEALYMLYFSGNNNPMIVELFLGGGKKVEGADAAFKPIDAELFKLQMQNRMNEICSNMLSEWGKSIAEENRRIKKEQASPQYIEWEKRKGHAGYNQWLSTLNPDQKIKILEYPNYGRIVGINDSLSAMLTSYTQHLRADPNASENLPFVASAITLGLSDYANIPNTLSGQIGINPIRDSSTQVMTPIVGPQAAELAGILGGMIAQAAALNATAQVLTTRGIEPVINQAYAKAFAQSILTHVADPSFASLAAGLFTTQSEQGQSSNEGQRLTDLLKASLLSTGLALMYRTESSVNGLGGGMSGREFVDLVEGNMELKGADPKMLEIAGYVRTQLGYLPAADKAKFYTAFATFIDTTPQVTDWLQLKHIKGLLQASTEAPILPV